MFNALSAVKFVASSLVGVGTGKIVSGIIKNNVTPETLLDKVTVLGAAWVIGGMATKATKTFTDETIDDVAKGVSGVVAALKLKSKIDKVNRGESTIEEEGLDPEKYQWDPIEKKVMVLVEDESVESCSWCSDPANPDPKFHPGEQTEHAK